MGESIIFHLCFQGIVLETWWRDGCTERERRPPSRPAPLQPGPHLFSRAHLPTESNVALYHQQAAFDLLVLWKWHYISKFGVAHQNRNGSNSSWWGLSGRWVLVFNVVHVTPKREDCNLSVAGWWSYTRYLISSSFLLCITWSQYEKT